MLELLCQKTECNWNLRDGGPGNHVLLGEIEGGILGGREGDGEGYFSLLVIYSNSQIKQTIAF